MADNIINKNDISLILKTYKNHGYDTLEKIVKDNDFSILSNDETKSIKKLILISSSPIDSIKTFYDKYLNMSGGKGRGRGRSKSKGRKKSKRRSKNKNSSEGYSSDSSSGIMNYMKNAYNKGMHYMQDGMHSMQNAYNHYAHPQHGQHMQPPPQQ